MSSLPEKISSEETAALTAAVPSPTLADRVLRFWRKETSLRARIANIGHLVTGNLFGSVIGMVGFLITARALGPTDYGLLALTYSYARVIERLLSFQSWQPLIKYGAELQAAEDRDALRSLLKFGLLVDVSAAVASYLVAIGLALFLGPLVGIGADALEHVLIYSTVLLFQINGFPTAVARLSGRFKAVAYGSLISGTLRLILCAIGLLVGAGLLYFVIVWTVTQIIAGLSFLTFAFWEMHRQGIRRVLAAPLSDATRRLKGLWHFTIGSKVELTIRSSTDELDTLLVGMLADPTSAGFYHIAKRLGRLVLQLGVQVQAVLYPDVARLWAKRAVAEFRRTVRQMEVLLAAFGLAVFAATAIGIQPLLYWTAGADFVAAAPLAIVQMVAVAMTLSGGAVRTALLSMGRQPAILKIVFAGALVFHATAFSTIPFIGAMGANIARVVMAAVLLVGMMLVYRAALKAQPLSG